MLVLDGAWVMGTTAYHWSLLLGLFPDRPTLCLRHRTVHVFRVRHYRRRAKRTNVRRMRPHIEFHRYRHPQQFAEDAANGFLMRLHHKYPNAAQQWCWQFVFPQQRRWRNSKTGEQGRLHIDESLFSRSLKAAVRKTGLTKRVTSHTYSSFLCDAPAGGRLRHTHGSGTTGPQGRSHDHDLHPRPETRRTWGSQPRGRAGCRSRGVIG